jgi:NAD(P)-dependent dehydrogenase (short-subunit alcohol dehydrogenase family)
MPVELNDKVIVVTGAAGGIGSACAQRFASERPRVVVCADLHTDAAQRVADEINASAGREVAIGRACDVGREESVRALIDDITRAYGVIDLYFANAGVSAMSDPMTPDEVWEREWRINTMAHVWAARHLLPSWIDRGHGYLLTTASMAGILTSLGAASYSTTKHAAVGFAEWVAVTYQDRGVRVSVLCPGGINTPMLAGFGGSAENASALIGGGDVMEPSEVADIVVAGVRDEATLIMTHPEMRTYVERKVADHGRWVAGMSRLWQRQRHLLD